MQKFEFIVQKNEKILKFLSESLKSFRYSDFCRALKNKDILVNGTRIKRDVLVNQNDKVEVFLPNQKFKFEIVFEDENIIVFDKPKGVEVCDGNYNILSEYKNFFGKDIYAIHRLDAGTSGLVLFAKNTKAEKFLIDEFKKHNVTKHYFAVVCGNPKQSEVLKSYLVKYPKDNIVKIFDKPVPNSSEIQTSYTLAKKHGDLSLLDVKITAGKTHQIRAHLAHFGMPIVGDDKYGNKEINKKYKKTKQMLTAYKIIFDVDKNSEFAYLNDLDLCLKCKFDIF